MVFQTPVKATNKQNHRFSLKENENLFILEPTMSNHNPLLQILCFCCCLITYSFIILIGSQHNRFSPYGIFILHSNWLSPCSSLLPITPFVPHMFYYPLSLKLFCPISLSPFLFPGDYPHLLPPKYTHLTRSQGPNERTCSYCLSVPVLPYIIQCSPVPFIFLQISLTFLYEEKNSSVYI